MKKFLSLLSILSLTFMVSCGGSKDAAEKVEDANQTISELNSIATSLNTEGVYLSSSYSRSIETSSDVKWLEEVKGQLEAYIAKGKVVISAGNDSEVYHSDSYKLEGFVSNAKSLLSSVKSQIDTTKNKEARLAQEAVERKKREEQDKKDKIEYFANNKSFEEIEKDLEVKGLKLSSDSETLADSINSYIVERGVEKSLEEIEAFLIATDAINDRFDELSYSDQQKIKNLKFITNNVKKDAIKGDYLNSEFFKSEVVPSAQKIEDAIKTIDSDNVSLIEKTKLLSLYKMFDKSSIEYQVKLESYISKHSSKSEFKSFVNTNEKRLMIIKSYRENLREKVSKLGVYLGTERNIEEAIAQ